MKSPACRSWRALLAARRLVLNKVRDVENGLRALLREAGLKLGTPARKELAVRVRELTAADPVLSALAEPLLTIIADFIGLIGGFIMSKTLLAISSSQYWTSAWQALEYNDIAQGLIKPFVFALIIALVGCFYGMRTSGGTQGVGRSTTTAVVVSSVWIFVLTAAIGRLFESNDQIMDAEEVYALASTLS